MIRNLFYKIILNQSVKILFASLPKRRKIQFLFLIVIFIIQSLAELLSIGSVIPFVTAISRPSYLLEEIQKYNYLKNSIFLQTENQLIIVSFILFLSLIVLSASFRLLALYANYRICILSGYEINLLIFKKILNQNISFFYKNDSSQLTSFITNKINMCASCLMHYFSIINNIILISIVFIALIIVNPTFTLLVFLFFLINYFLVVFFFRNRVKRNSYNLAKLETAIIKLLREALQNIKIMIIHKLQNYYFDLFSDMKLKREKSFISNLSIASLPKIFMETTAIILISSIAFFIIYYEKSNFISLLPFFAIIALTGQKLLPIFQQLYFSYSALLSDSVSVKEVTEFYTNKENQIQKNENFEILTFNNSISFNNVCFDYGHHKFSINNISVTFKKGQKIGVVGKSGSGKSTFIDLLMGLIQPNKGNIKIDNSFLDLKNIPKWHSLIGHIPQSTFLNNETIYENIAYGFKKDQINLNLVNKIIKKLNLEDLISKMDSGYNTKVGEKGSNISGGQRQKIAFARSFYRDFEVLIIDEGTSSMDNLSEEAIFKELYKLTDKTIFIVSHRLAFLKSCDQIIEFDNGKIKNVGSYSQLLKESESFRDLAKNTK